VETPPTGTVSFLFTDIESSTVRWETDPESMSRAVAAHDQILREEIEMAQGYVFSTGGDSFAAAFSHASRALATAVAVQLALEDADTNPRLRVRMAVHTGEAEERSGNYYGPALNRCARLLGLASGGQILVSSTSAQVLRQQLPPYVGLRELGEHRLRDLSDPERIFQATHPGLRVRFPALTGAIGIVHNLPELRTSFVGRSMEMGELGVLLRTESLITLVGPGGSGKTRLALEAARSAIGGHPDGVWMIDLAPVARSELVIEQVAAPLGVQDLEPEAGRDLMEIITDYLQHKKVLMVVDNCEHVIEAAASVAIRLLERCPDLAILATSRETLGVPGEVTFPVRPLPRSAGQVDEASDAARLFLQRAGMADGVATSREDRDAVDEIVEHLDGMPLAIELAAARAGVLSPREIADRLGERLDLLSQRKGRSERHSTLRATLDWSYQLLEPHERTILSRLAVFTDGWTPASAEVVCSDEEISPTGVLDALGGLVDKSLVDTTRERDVTRHRLLETVKQYALEKLEEQRAARELRDRHADYHLELAKTTDPRLRGPEQGRYVAMLDAEHDNIRAALEWVSSRDHYDRALALAAAMGWFWWMRGHWGEARQWFERLYEPSRGHADEELRAGIVVGLAAIEIMRSRPSEVRSFIEEALAVLREGADVRATAWAAALAADATAFEDDRCIELYEESEVLFAGVGDAWGEAFATFSLGTLLIVRGADAERGEDLARRGLAAIEATGDRWSAGWFSFNLGSAFATLGRFDEARSCIERSLDLVTGTGDVWVVPHVHCRLGVVAAMSHRYDEAVERLESVLPQLQQIGDEGCIALSSLYLGEAVMARDGVDQAAPLIIAALTGYGDLRNRSGIAGAYRRLARLSLERGNTAGAIIFLGAADSEREAIGGYISSHDKEYLASIEAPLAGMIDGDEEHRLRAEGAALTVDMALDLAAEITRD